MYHAELDDTSTVDGFNVGAAWRALAECYLTLLLAVYLEHANPSRRSRAGVLRWNRTQMSQQPHAVWRANIMARFPLHQQKAANRGYRILLSFFRQEMHHDLHNWWAALDPCADHSDYCSGVFGDLAGSIAVCVVCGRGAGQIHGTSSGQSSPWAQPKQAALDMPVSGAGVRYQHAPKTDGKTAAFARCILAA